MSKRRKSNTVCWTNV